MNEHPMAVVSAPLKSSLILPSKPPSFLFGLETHFFD